MEIRNGSVRLFRLFGISVYLHWSWLIVAAIMVQFRRGMGVYDTPVWALVEYVSLFVIVLTHEFGHALACRSVGGKAEHIMLWPLGGIAYVSPPMRPGALLWSIFAGPLVNILLLPVSFFASAYLQNAGASTNVVQLAYAITEINVWLLIFNLMPIYPLDGGQILHALLWFILGFARSLRVASVLGMIGAVGLLAFFLYVRGGPMMYVIVAFLGLQAYNGYRTASYLAEHPEQAARLEQTRPGEEPTLILDETPPPLPPREQQRPAGEVRVPPPFDSDQYRPPRL